MALDLALSVTEALPTFEINHFLNFLFPLFIRLILDNVQIVEMEPYPGINRPPLLRSRSRNTPRFGKFHYFENFRVCESTPAKS